MASNISVGALLSRAYDFCWKRYMNEEIQFLINVFTKNGHERSELQNSPLPIKTIVKNATQFILVKKKQY